MLTNKCPNCSSYNPDDAVECYFCHQAMPGAKKGRKPPKKERDGKVVLAPAVPQRKWTEEKRPMGIALMAILCFTIAIYSVSSGLCLITMNDPNVMALINGSPYGFFAYIFMNIFSLFNESLLALVEKQFILVVLVYLTVTVIGLAVGWGLWNLKRWMRVLLMVLQAVFVLAVLLLPDNPALAFFQAGLTPGGGMVDILRVSGIVIGIALYVYFFVWLLLNERQFRR